MRVLILRQEDFIIGCTVIQDEADVPRVLQRLQTANRDTGYVIHNIVPDSVDQLTTLMRGDQ